jgi:hypothetical protein
VLREGMLTVAVEGIASLVGSDDTYKSVLYTMYYLYSIIN